MRGEEMDEKEEIKGDEKKEKQKGKKKEHRK